MSSSLPLALLSTGAALHYYGETTSLVEVEKIVDTPKAPKESKPSIDAGQLDTYLLMIKGVKKLLKYSKKAILQVKFIMTSGLVSINLGDWIRSPKFMESMILLLGTIVMAYSNFKSFKDKTTLLSKVTTIGGSLLAESKSILMMHQLMTGISDLARTRKPPIKELSIAGAMIVASHVASRYSK